MIKKIIAFIGDIENLEENFTENLIKRWGGIRSNHPQKLGDNIVILGNGPSQDFFLNNLEDFKEYDLLCVNSFPQYNEKDFIQLKPKYFCAVDPMLMDKTVAVKTGKLEEYERLRSVFSRVTWSMTVITWDRFNFEIDNSFINVIKINSSVYRGNSFYIRKKLCLKNKSTLETQTVAMSALFFSVIFGYKEIAIFGVDHDDFKELEFNEAGEIYGKTWHAYDKNQPEICKIRGGIGEHYIYEIFEGYMKIFKAYLELQKLAQSLHCHIINYNSKSYVDAFEKSRKYEE